LRTCSMLESSGAIQCWMGTAACYDRLRSCGSLSISRHCLLSRWFLALRNARPRALSQAAIRSILLATWPAAACLRVIVTASLPATKTRLPAITNFSFSAQTGHRYPKFLFPVFGLPRRRRLAFSNRNRISSRKLCPSPSHRHRIREPSRY